MKSLELILKEQQEKARSLANAIKSQIDKTAEEEIKNNLEKTEVDEIVKATLEKFLKTQTKTTKKLKTKAGTTLGPTLKPKIAFSRLSLEDVKEAYDFTGLKPYEGTYWFYEDLDKSPLIQYSSLNEDRTAATPLAAYTLMQRQKLLSRENPPKFITDYRDLERPSNKWTAGRISQVSGLSVSYVLGFKSGFANNATGHRACSTEYHAGYADGRKILEAMIEAGDIKKLPDHDIYEGESDEHILSELSRVRGYKRAL